MKDSFKRKVRKIVMAHGLYKKPSGHTACFCGAEVVWVAEDQEWECPVFFQKLDEVYAEE